METLIVWRSVVPLSDSLQALAGTTTLKIYLFDGDLFRIALGLFVLMLIIKAAVFFYGLIPFN
jgi:hypothetical protein